MFLAGTPAAGPGPLEIVATEPACDVHRLADGVKTWHRFCFHGFGRKLIGINAARGYLRLGEALGTLGYQRSILESGSKRRQVRECQGLRQPLRQEFG